jgi:hypothetical protein
MKTSLPALSRRPSCGEEVLDGVFNDEVKGIDCVLTTETEVNTYTVRSGEIAYKGRGDLHQEEYNEYELCVPLTDQNRFNNKSAVYTLCMYPTEALFAVYSTTNPTIMSIGAVCIILLTSALFFLYDLVV